MDPVEHVIYINLAHRTDRKEQVEQELFKYFPHEKVTRFEAIQSSPGCVGCYKSHRGALQLAIEKNYENVLIVEDDCQFVNTTNFAQIKTLMKQPWDVILFGATYAKRSSNFRVRNAQTATAYLVNRTQYSTLLENMNEGIPLLEKHLKGPYWNDQYWKRLQEKHNWFLVHPCIVVQRPSYSDNENRHVDYVRFFNH